MDTLKELDVDGFETMVWGLRATKGIVVFSLSLRDSFQTAIGHKLSFRVALRYRTIPATTAYRSFLSVVLVTLIAGHPV